MPQSHWGESRANQLANGNFDKSHENFGVFYGDSCNSWWHKIRSQHMRLMTQGSRITANHIRWHEEYIVMHHYWSQCEYSQYQENETQWARLQFGYGENSSQQRWILFSHNENWHARIICDPGDQYKYRGTARRRYSQFLQSMRQHLLPVNIMDMHLSKYLPNDTPRKNKKNISSKAYT